MDSVLQSRVSRGAGAPKEFPAGLRFAFWTCVAIAIAVVVRRVVALISPTTGGPPQMVRLDAVFSGHAALTLAHILPAAAFVLLSPFALSRTFAGGRRILLALYALGVWVGATAYAMSTYPVGGWLERSAVLVFNSLFLWELGRSYLLWRRGEVVEGRRWLIRAIAVLLGIATTRPVMGVFFATSRLTHLEPSQFFGIAFWIGFTINTVTIEAWLRMQAKPPAVDGTA
jgi:hypothetical protein